MSCFCLLFCLGLALASTAHAEWRAAAKECGNAVAEQTGCASCSALWREISRCAAQTEGMDPNRVETCIQRVSRQTSAEPMYFDRIAAVFACMGK